MIQNPPDNRHDTVLPLPLEVRADAWAVDAACSGNPGPMEYQAIDLATGARVFHFGPMKGTNNIGEFLAIVHALALMQQQGLHSKTIYSDSYNAILWVNKRKCKTKLERTPETEQDKIRAYPRNGAALSDYCSCRALVTDTPMAQSHHQVGNSEVGRSAC